MNKRQLITEADVRAAAQRSESTIRMSPGAIVTPLALDTAQTAGVRFEIVREETAPESGARLVFAVTRQGFPLKRTLLDFIKVRGIDAVEIPSTGDDEVTAAVEAVKRIAGGGVPFGVVIDGTGMQTCMVANRFAGIRAVHAAEARHAGIARARFDANLLTLGAEFLSPRRAADVLAAFFDTRPAANAR